MYLLFRITHHLCAGSHWVSERGGRSPRCRAAVRPEHCSTASKDDMKFYQTIYLFIDGRAAVRPFRGEQRRHDILPNHITFTDGREKILKQLNRSKLPWSMIRPVSCRSFSIPFLYIFFPGLSVHLELLWWIVSVCKSASQHFWAESLLTLLVITIYLYFSDTLLL